LVVHLRRLCLCPVLSQLHMTLCECPPHQRRQLLHCHRHHLPVPQHHIARPNGFASASSSRTAPPPPSARTATLYSSCRGSPVPCTRAISAFVSPAHRWKCSDYCHSHGSCPRQSDELPLSAVLTRRTKISRAPATKATARLRRSISRRVARLQLGACKKELVATGKLGLCGSSSGLVSASALGPSLCHSFL
jgi:hypothetical protein